MEQLPADLHFGLRQLRLNPTFTTVAVLSLALGIGANTAIFQLIDAVRLPTLPVRDPQGLGYIDFAKGSERSGWFSTRTARFSYAQWEVVRDRQQASSRVFAWSATQFNLAESGKARYAQGQFVSVGFFDTLGVLAIIGHTFTEADDKPNCESPGAVLS
jgi:putative ABC transport system permease protein